jgi:hypothetical protein
VHEAGRALPPLPSGARRPNLLPGNVEWLLGHKRIGNVQVPPEGHRYQFAARTALTNTSPVGVVKAAMLRYCASFDEGHHNISQRELI